MKKKNVFLVKNRLASLVSIIFAVIFLIFFLPRFLGINSIEVVGNVSCASSGEIPSSLNLKGQNIFTINEEELQKTARQKYPCLQNLTVERKLPLGVKLIVSEREALVNVVSLRDIVPSSIDLSSPVASSASLLDWSFSASSGNIWQVDKTGIVFKQEGRVDVPTLFIAKENLQLGQSLDEEIFLNIALTLSKFKKMDLPVTQLKMIDNTIFIDSKPRVVLVIDSDLPRKLASLQLILQKAKIDGKAMDIVDLRFNKPVVIYSPKT